MTIIKIFEQAKSLSLEERKELIKMLIDSLNAEPVPADEGEPEVHWGQNLLRLLDEIGPIELVDPHIEDPVEWVKAQRRKRQDKLKPYWD